MTFVLSSRQLWVEHLELFEAEIMEVFVTLLPAGTIALQQALRRFSAQLVDLCPRFIQPITRHVMQSVIDNIEKHLETPEGSEINEEEEAEKDNKKIIRYRNSDSDSLCSMIVLFLVL